MIAPAAEQRRGFIRRLAIDVTPLRYADFRRLWLGSGVSLIGFQLTAVAVPVQMYGITASSFWVGMIGVAGLVPLIVFGLWGGAISDAVDRRTLLIVAGLVSWACTLVLLAQALAGARSAGLLLVLVAVQSAAYSIGSASRNAVIPRLIGKPLVASANTLNHTVHNFAGVLGPLLAGLVLSQASFAAAYAIDAALFSVALYATARLPHLAPEGKVRRPGLRSVLEGLAFIWRRPVLLMTFAADLVAMVFAMPRALFPQAAAERFTGPGAVGWLFSAIAIGSVVGGLSSGWIGRVRRQGVALVIAIAGWGVAVAAAGLARSLWLAVVLLAVAGAADLVSAVFRQTILQVYAPDELRGRLQGVFIVVVAGGPRLGDVRAGSTASAVGLTASWAGGGIACAVIVVAMALLWRPLVRYRAEIT